MANKILVVMLITLCIISFLNGVQEDGIKSGVIGAAFAMLGPLIFSYMAYTKRKTSISYKFSYIGVMFLNSCALVMYSIYLYSGQSNPDTAGHMHIIMFPIVFIFFGTFIMKFFTLLDEGKDKISHTSVGSLKKS